MRDASEQYFMDKNPNMRDTILRWEAANPRKCKWCDMPYSEASVVPFEIWEHGCERRAADERRVSL